MKLSGLILHTLWASALAAPAVVWKNNRRTESSVVHTSKEYSASSLLKDVLGGDAKGSSLGAVVFLVGKGEDGSESLTELASSGKLPTVAEKYGDADGVYHHVSGIESTTVMVREASRANAGHRVLQVSLSEFNSKLTSLKDESEAKMVEVGENGVLSKASQRSNKRTRELADANVFVVSVSPKEDASEIDRVVAETVDSELVENVVLAGVRSLQEVKHERYMMSKRRLNAMEKQGQRVLESRRRRLEQEEEQGDEGDDAVQNGDNDSNDMSGVYYVAMTPNILAGLLFGLLFVTVTWIGVSCMGAIAGQEIYVSKMPTIGREA